MLTLICLISALVTIFYVSYRLKAKLGSRKIFWLYAVFFLLATVGYVALIMTGTYTSDNRYVSVLYVVLGLLFAFHLYFFFLTVVAQVFERYLPGKRGKVATVVSVFLAWAIVAAGLYFSHTPRVTEHVVKVKGLAAPVTIMNAPDMHLGPARGAGFLKKVLAEIEKRNPDIVVYNGDLIDGNIALKEEIFSLFAGVKSPQYLTTGNHEFYVDTARELEFAKAAGMKIIRN
ncbi:MAG: metallophosphoesterase, partial [Deltaproteobacteria bacterium]|nr:metallophosphoesterase [Deltaproteobacteria bacterium]